MKNILKRFLSIALVFISSFFVCMTANAAKSNCGYVVVQLRDFVDMSSVQINDEVSLSFHSEDGIECAKVVKINMSKHLVVLECKNKDPRGMKKKAVRELLVIRGEINSRHYCRVVHTSYGFKVPVTSRIRCNPFIPNRMDLLNALL